MAYLVVKIMNYIIHKIYKSAWWEEPNIGVEMVSIRCIYFSNIIKQLNDVILDAACRCAMRSNQESISISHT
jgi:hypothetical protein